MSINKKMFIGTGIIVLLILGAVFVYNRLNPPPEPIAVTAEPVERERKEEYADRLAELEEKNKVDSLLDNYTDVTYQYISYNEAGEELFNILVVATKDSVMYSDATGHIEYLNDGRWIGFDPEENSAYTMVCVNADTYKEEWDYLRDSASFYFDTLTVTDSVKENGAYTTVTRSAKITDENVALFQHTWPSVLEGDVFMDVYTFGEDVFLTESYSIVRSNEDSQEKEEIVLGKVMMTMDSGVLMDDGILETINSEEQRTLSLCADIGTDEERMIVEKTGVGTEFLFALPEGYEHVYLDKECKIPLESQDQNEDLEAYIYKSK